MKFEFQVSLKSGFIVIKFIPRSNKIKGDKPLLIKSPSKIFLKDMFSFPMKQILT